MTAPARVRPDHAGLEPDPTADDSDLADTTDAAPAEPARRAGAPLVVHLAGYLLVIVALLAMTHLGDSWALDDGAYATQVKVVEQTGGWAYPYAFEAHDPTLAHFPVAHSTLTDQGRAYPYVKLPAWIVVLRASTKVFGQPLGFYVPSVLGALAAAATAWVLAGRFRRRVQPWAFWAVAAGPLLVHTTAMWAHTWGAALGGLCAILLLDIARGRTNPLRIVGLAAVLASVCMLRTEGMLLSLATLLVLGVIGLAQRKALVARVVHAAAITVVPAIAAAASVKLTQRWSAGLIAGVPVANDADTLFHVTWLNGRWMGFTRTLLSGAGFSPLGDLYAIAAVALFLVAGRLLSRGRGPLGLGALVGGIALVALRSLSVAPQDLGGLLVAVPLLSVVAGAVPWRRLDPARWALVAWAGLFALGVFATQHPEGGSRDWGGRYLFLVLPALTVAAVGIAARLVEAAPSGPDRRALGAVVIAAALLPTLVGLHAANDLRAANGATTSASLAPGSQVVIRTSLAYTRASWRVLPEQDWIFAKPPAIPSIVKDLRADGIDTVTVSGYGAETVDLPGFTKTVVDEEIVVFKARTP